MHDAVEGHEGPKHGLKVGATSCQNSFVCRNGCTVELQRYVAKLLSSHYKQVFQILF